MNKRTTAQINLTLIIISSLLSFLTGMVAGPSLTPIPIPDSTCHLPQTIKVVEFQTITTPPTIIEKEVIKTEYVMINYSQKDDVRKDVVALLKESKCNVPLNYNKEGIVVKKTIRAYPSSENVWTGVIRAETRDKYHNLLWFQEEKSIVNVNGSVSCEPYYWRVKEFS